MPSEFLTSFQFDFCRVIIWNDEYLETLFEDGRSCPAVLHDNAETRQTAHELGYPNTEDGVRRMHIEHELGHTFIAERLLWPWSKCLHRVARGESWSFDHDRDREENLVLAFQRYLNTGERREILGQHFSDDELALLKTEFEERFQKPLDSVF